MSHQTPHVSDSADQCIHFVCGVVPRNAESIFVGISDLMLLYTEPLFTCVYNLKKEDGISGAKAWLARYLQQCLNVQGGVTHVSLTPQCDDRAIFCFLTRDILLDDECVCGNKKTLWLVVWE
uniref:Uncharacterized protein n=1 Tax=Percolomonas cosmopolitus TaxID=63605 RepID=A0A7S1PIQ6_9EUKA|mmetsp:Transcript_7544/g.28348  ORF Transcript_7544/g.28348 Transcript_7544/m.28348 type:complete len:122 (+) Transcript_7544:159-524(+)